MLDLQAQNKKHKRFIMTKSARLSEKLAKREQLHGTILHVTGSSAMIEAINEDYLDYVIFDMEHGIYNNENLIPILQTCRLIDLPAFVRVPDCTYHHISRCLDLGAIGVMIPRAETLEQVALAVSSMRFPPIGKKGRGGYCQLREGETSADFQKNRHLLIQMESPLGIENLPKMLEQYGEHIGGVLVGPYDLSFTMGIERQFDSPEFIGAVQKVFDICKEYNISAGIFCDSINDARKWRAMGANLMWVCCDDQLMRFGLRSQIKALADEV